MEKAREKEARSSPCPIVCQIAETGQGLKREKGLGLRVQFQFAGACRKDTILKKNEELTYKEAEWESDPSENIVLPKTRTNKELRNGQCFLVTSQRGQQFAKSEHQVG